MILILYGKSSSLFTTAAEKRAVLVLTCGLGLEFVIKNALKRICRTLHNRLAYNCIKLYSKPVCEFSSKTFRRPRCHIVTCHHSMSHVTPNPVLFKHAT